jgi:enoyl-CoA hydratase/carnithine racemase
MSPTDGQVRLERNGHVGLITIDRPAKLNAMTVAMDREMNAILHEVNNDDVIHALLLTGAGERAFSAGSDITDLDAYGTNWKYRVVVAINGYAIGGGLEMACASDIRLATPESSFGAGEIRWGWHGGSGQTQFLTRAIGPGHALRLLLTGDRIDGNEAYRIGLVQELLPRERLMERALELARTIASRPPIAVQSAKNLVRVAQSTSVEIGLAYENDMFSYLMLTRDAAEGRRAFVEKREPEFKGE